MRSVESGKGLPVVVLTTGHTPTTGVLPVCEVLEPSLPEVEELTCNKCPSAEGCTLKIEVEDCRETCMTASTCHACTPQIPDPQAVVRFLTRRHPVCALSDSFCSVSNC